MYISPNIPRREALPLSNICGISITTELGKYLGTPLLHTRFSKNHLQDILDRMAKKLSGWKVKNLSLTGRATLAKAATSSMPNHLMQTMEIPRRVCDQIDKLNRNFLWGNTEDRKKVHLVNWQQVCKSKSNGGLGIRQARVQNLALISKLGWKLTINSDELWCKILKAKYLKDQSVSNWPNQRRASHTWKSIIRNEEVQSKNIKWNVGIGENIALWTDWWCGNQPLKLKLNTDGSSKGDPGQSGFGGLLRDELWGIYRGLTIIMQKGLTNIDIETDSQTAMELIRDGTVANSPYRALIKDANFLLRCCQCTLKAIPREANQSADALANLGVNQHDHTVFLEDPLSSILSFLITDMSTVSSSRD
ncbi:hypothetical protein CsSME_00047717 [Camellia sinensis var. sinensis]